MNTISKTYLLSIMNNIDSCDYFLFLNNLNPFTSENIFLNPFLVEWKKNLIKSGQCDEYDIVQYLYDLMIEKNISELLIY